MIQDNVGIGVQRQEFRARNHRRDLLPFGKRLYRVPPATRLGTAARSGPTGQVLALPKDGPAAGRPTCLPRGFLTLTRIVRA